jgi:hypothetical protein
MNSLGKTLALNFLVHNNANSMLGDTVDSSSSAMVTFVGHSFLNSTYSLDTYNITLLVDLYVCSQRNNSMFPKRPKKHILGSSPLSLCIHHLANYCKKVVSAKRHNCI